MKPSCGLGGAALPGCVPAASADLAVPSALAEGGGSSEPRTPQPPKPRQSPAASRAATIAFGVNDTRMSPTTPLWR